MVDLKRVEAMFWRNLKLLSECTPSSPVTQNVFELLERERKSLMKVVQVLYFWMIYKRFDQPTPAAEILHVTPRKKEI